MKHSKKFILVSLAALAFSFNVVAQDAIEIIPEDPVVGEIKGKQVRLSDIMNSRIHEQYVGALRNIDGEFRRYALSQLAADGADYKDIEEFTVTEQQAKEFYEKNNLAQQGEFEQLRGQLEGFLKNQQFFEQFAQAEKANLVTNFITLPAEPQLKVSVHDVAIRKWNKESEVMVLEFSDYQCPYCLRVQGTVEQLMTNYKDKVGFAYKHMPLPFHKEADEAANAAECAKDQGKFEEIHAILFANPRKQFVDDLKQYGRDVEIADLEKYDSCVDEGTYNTRVQQYMQIARQAGINGTPGFVIGRYDAATKTVTGIVLSGAQPYARFEEAIKSYLN